MCNFISKFLVLTGSPIEYVRFLANDWTQIAKTSKFNQLSF